jgi:cell division protein FtsX
MLCGASKRKIVLNYLSTTMLYALFSAVVGLSAFCVTKNLGIYNYSNLSSFNNLSIAFVLYLVIVMVSALGVIAKTINNITNDYKEVLT